MNIKHLEHLLALADTGSFSRAAEQVFITQSALSHGIQSLEQVLAGRSEELAPALAYFRQLLRQHLHD